MSNADRRVVEFFLGAYRQGAFPMAEPGRGPGVFPGRTVDWFVPDPRAIIPLFDGNAGKTSNLGGFHLPRSLGRLLRRHPFRITADQCFERVIRECAAPRPGREETWLDDRLISSYLALHRAGYAHSIEAWTMTSETPELVGGIYGVQLGSVFCAESMFCSPERGGSNASKICLAYLVRHLCEQEFRMLDVQIRNSHTDRFGVIDVPAGEYLNLLSLACEEVRSWGKVRPEWMDEAGAQPA